MPLPPPGHPHYMSEADRQALVDAVTKKYNIDPEDEDAIDMSTSAAQQKYQELRKKIAEAKKTMEDTAQGLFSEMSAEFFNENPTLVSFGWTQYTPYWCDGDVCEFGCNSNYPTVGMEIDGVTVSHDSNSGRIMIDGEKVEDPADYIRNFKSLGVDEFKKNGKSYAYDAKTNTVTVNGAPFPSYDDYEKQFDVLERKVAKFMKNFEDEDME